MIAFYILLALLTLWGLSFRKASDTDYLSREQGNSVKGFFILVVFLSHATNYLIENGHQFTSATDKVYFFMQGNLGQLCVVMFLFFSGYGVMSSIMSKGMPYVRSIPKHRALGTLVNFDIAVLIFAVAQLIAGKTFTPVQYLLALTGWESIGNSNWYIFVIIILYLGSWLSARIVMSRPGKADPRMIILINLLLATVLFAVLQFTKEPYWFTTIYAYPLGMGFVLLKPRFDELKGWKWWLALIASLACLAATYPKHQDPFYLVYTIKTISFALVCVLLLRRIKIGNPVLDWAGKNLFPLYIYQRLPMIFFPPENPYIFIVACLAITCLIVPVYNRFLKVRL